MSTTHVAETPVSTDNIYLHTLSSSPKSRPDAVLAYNESAPNAQQHDPEDAAPAAPAEEHTTAALPLQKWNHPRANIPRLLSTFFSMFVFGLNDGAWGALIPYVSSYYSLSYTVVSLVFLCPFAGYTIAAFTNAWFHAHTGQRGIALLAPTCYLVTYVALSTHPSWPVVVVFTAVGGFGSGLIDGAWSSWAGHMVAGNVLEGALHSFYALGATLAPLIVTSIVVRRRWQWYCYYYVMAGLAAVELCVCAVSFWPKTAAVYRAEHASEVGAGGAGADANGQKESPTKRVLKNRVTWLCSAFFLLYVGAEVALGGWIVSFMLHVRNASPYVSGITATGFWAGMALGRVALGVLTHTLIELTNKKVPPQTQLQSSTPSLSTNAYVSASTSTSASVDHHHHHKRFRFRYRSILHLRLTERSIVTVYLLLAILVELLFWLVPSITASAVAVALLGMFLGPVFPSGIIMATKLLPPHLHLSSVGFSTAIGGTGGAVFPFAVGAIAQARGVQVLQPIVLAMLALLVGLWWCFPRVGGVKRE